MKRTSGINELISLKRALSMVVSLVFVLQIAYAGDVVVENGRIDVDSIIFVDTLGNVGIGTTTPAEKLDVVGGNTKIEDSNEVFLSLRNSEVSGREWALVSAGSAGGIGVGKFSVYDRSLSQARLTIDTDGKVGIGTINPNAALTVRNSGNEAFSFGYLAAGTGTTAEHRIRYDSAGTIISADHTNLNAASYLTLDVGGVTGLRINDNGDVYIAGTGGNVGIGTTSPGTKLAVDESTDAFAQINIDSGSTVAQYSAIDFADRGTNKWGIGKDTSNNFYIDQTGVGNAITIDSNRNVGIGTPSPAEKLDVQGNVEADAYFYSSDLNLKKNIVKVDGLNSILKLNGVSFNWKESGEESLGLIAQDVEKVFPEVVKTNKETGLKTVNYGVLVGPLVEAVKELDQINNKQEQKLAELEKEIENLKKELEHINPKRG